MPGTVFQLGQTMVRPGFYFRVTNNSPAGASQPQGIVAALVRASWGPVGSVQKLSSPDAAKTMYGSNGTANAVINQNFAGGAQTVLSIRIGESDGAGATISLADTTDGTAVQVVKLTLSVGEDGNKYTATVRDSLTDPTSRQLIVYNGQTVAQTFTFAKGETDDGEPASLVAAVTAANLNWISATKLADGNKTLAPITQSAFSDGTDPTVDAEAISNALDLLSTETWDVLCVDSDDPTIHAQVQAWIDNAWDNGQFGLATVGEPTSVDLATRQADAAGFNDFLISYALNGFVDANGSEEGYLAAARLAGMIAAAPITSSMTHAIVSGATDVVGKLSNPDIIASEQSGAIVFTLNSNGAVQIDKGINTLVTPSADLDAGWKKIRRLKTRIYLMYTIAATWDPLVGKVDNDADGQSTLIGAAQSVISDMVKMGALLDGTVSLDPDNPPTGDSAWFTYAVDDIDSAEILYGTFGFEFAPPSTAS